MHKNIKSKILKGMLMLNRHSDRIIRLSFVSYIFAFLCLILNGFLNGSLIGGLCTVLMISFLISGALLSGIANLCTMDFINIYDPDRHRDAPMLEKDQEICYHNDKEN